MSDLTPADFARIAAEAMGQEYVEDLIVADVRRAEANQDKEPDLHQRRPGESEPERRARVHAAQDEARTADRAAADAAFEERRQAREDAKPSDEDRALAEKTLGAW